MIPMRRARRAGKPRTTLSATAEFCAWTGLSLSCACAVDTAEPRRLDIRVWQPERLAEGEGDLLADASRVDVTIVIDGERQTNRLSADFDVMAYGAVAGRLIEVELGTAGRSLRRAEGRTGERL
ncbi:MAG: hypothetical protein ACO3JL_12635, partial [Myxococcota bacterium]